MDVYLFGGEVTNGTDIIYPVGMLLHSQVVGEARTLHQLVLQLLQHLDDLLSSRKLDSLRCHRPIALPRE